MMMKTIAPINQPTVNEFNINNDSFCQSLHNLRRSDLKKMFSNNINDLDVPVSLDTYRVYTCTMPIVPDTNQLSHNKMSFGLKITKFFKNIIIPNCPMSFMTYLADDIDDQKKKNDLKSSTKKFRISELPIYSEENKCPQDEEKTDNNSIKLSMDDPKRIAKIINDTITNVGNKTINFKNNIYFKIGEIKDNIDEYRKEFLEKLRAEENLHLRCAFIMTGGVTGVILALRRGKFKKTLYSTLGTISTTALCYPDQAKKAYQMTRHGIKMAYYKFNGFDLSDHYEKNDPKVKIIKNEQITLEDELKEITERLFSKNENFNNTPHENDKTALKNQDPVIIFKRKVFQNGNEDADSSNPNRK
ncbi:uncharacterized protein LOC126899941 [Daktulosphaira vitifoliae]|uniref:uncharacterized protein LOC126899941 n=1 Tax=Daktulosphaira vitifoliae TaxID=58002 RepID=UPI0021AA1640|nr:uncharacterized protein LOC126899941 [Daktulosphaira vitifoliae]